MFKVDILETSKELTAKERVSIKDTTACLKLDLETQDAPVEIFPDFYAILSVSNDKADPPVYENYVIVDKNGNKYVTGSASFWSSFKQIADEMNGSDEEWGIKAYRVDSKNYKGKQFLTCTII